MTTKFFVYLDSFDMDEYDDVHRLCLKYLLIIPINKKKAMIVASAGNNVSGGVLVFI